MRWEILILTQPSRHEHLKRLMATLAPQLTRDVQVTATFFKDSWLLGENRQAMVDRSTAEYVNFIDDDDLVPDDYVATILPLLDGVDFVGFNVALFVDGDRIGTAYHSLRHKHWWKDGDSYYRDLSYMNPIRRELALRSRIEGGYGEDRRWAARLREIGCVRTERYVDRELYFYYFVSNKRQQAAAG